jgi:hypothetical protein
MNELCELSAHKYRGIVSVKLASCVHCEQHRRLVDHKKYKRRPNYSQSENILLVDGENPLGHGTG